MLSAGKRLACAWVLIASRRQLRQTKTWMSEAPYDFDRPMPMAIRLLLIAAGLFCILMPAYEFRHVFLHPSLLTLFFGAITLGAWSVGSSFVFAGIAGADQTWRFADGRLTIQNRNLMRQWQLVVTSRDIIQSFVRDNDSDSGPNTHSVVLQLQDGTNLDTHGLDTPEAAEKFRLRILAYLAVG